VQWNVWFTLALYNIYNIQIHTPSFFNTSLLFGFSWGFSIITGLVITDTGGHALWATRHLVLSEVDFLTSSASVKFFLGNFNKQDIINFQMQTNVKNKDVMKLFHTPSFFNTSLLFGFRRGFSVIAGLVITGRENHALWATRRLVLSEVDFLTSSASVKFSLGNFNKRVIIYFQMLRIRSSWNFFLKLG